MSNKDLPAVNTFTRCIRVRPGPGHFSSSATGSIAPQNIGILWAGKVSRVSYSSLISSPLWWICLQTPGLWVRRRFSLVTRREWEPLIGLNIFDNQWGAGVKRLVLILLGTECHDMSQSSLSLMGHYHFVLASDWPSLSNLSPLFLIQERHQFGAVWQGLWPRCILFNVFTLH